MNGESTIRFVIHLPDHDGGEVDLYEIFDCDTLAKRAEGLFYLPPLGMEVAYGNKDYVKPLGAVVTKIVYYGDDNEYDVSLKVRDGHHFPTEYLQDPKNGWGTE